MTFGKKTHDALAADAGVAALVGGRIFPMVLPQKDGVVTVTYPAIRYAVVSDIERNGLEGQGGPREARVQVDCFAKRYDAAQALADAVCGALSVIVEPGFTSMQAGRRDQYEDETGTYSAVLDFSMWMTEA